jgi:putative tricarboxylic transport membrane protein
MKLARLALAAALFAAVPLTSTDAQIRDLKILVPAAPGGGWDQTGRALQAALLAGKLVQNVQVMNVPGAGGTIGLAQFVNNMRGDGGALIVSGYVMVGAIIANKSPVTLEQVTPIARLTAEYEALVVPAASPIKSIGDLVAMLKADPGKVSWGGGSAGGVDHVAAGMITKAAGVDPTKINYIAFSGGGEAMASILGGKVTVGISGVGEVEAQVKTGRLRLIAVSSPDRLPGVNAPTLRESGLAVDIRNWRMVAAPPGVSAEQRKALTDTIQAMVKSKPWQDTLAAKGWSDAFLAGPEFDAALKKEFTDTRTILIELGIAK